jgi:hypothetical protein
MSTKTTRIISFILMLIPSAMLVMGAVMKLIGAAPIKEGLTKAGFGNIIFALGLIELGSVALFLIPKTHKVGFLLLCGYLGGATAVELAGQEFPVAAVLLAVIWVAVYLRNKAMFVVATDAK